MKHNFMNKENGKVASVLVMYLDDEGHMQTDSYDKVEDLMDDYAAYEQAKPEPLIKDEKIRKAVRAWAEANGVSELFSYEAVSGCPFWYIMAYRGEGGLTLDLWGEFPKELTNDKSYTIAELCGEEEE